MNIATHIDAIVESRRSVLPAIQAKLEQLRATEAALQRLQPAVAAVAHGPKASPELKALTASFNFAALCRRASEARAAQERLYTRFSRDTVNIGVSGQARVGKSTLLQTLAGLDDDALPTGTGTPVTAVRSRIVNARVPRARLEMHSWDSFRDEVLAPYHEELGIPGLPAAPDQFRSWPYPAPGTDTENATNVLLKKLTAIRDQLGGYLPDLTGRERVIDNLSELRVWVAYPKTSADGRLPPPRYLAVKHAVIECPFATDTGRIALVDLPGLGEIAARAEEHHVRGLRDEVDHVLFVKRAVEGMAYWKAEDARARKLIDAARRPIAQASDYVGIVSNEPSGTDAAMLEAMLKDIAENASVGLGDHPLALYRCDAQNTDSVMNDVLLPVLARLAERLPVMDQELVAAVQLEVEAAASDIRREMHALTTELQRALPEAPGTAERLEDLARERRQDVSVDLAALLRDLRTKARESADDEAFIAAVQNTHRSIEDWARNEVLGIGRDRWMKNALGNASTVLVLDNFAAHELNRIRVHIGETYCQLDAHLNARIAELWDSLAAIMRKNTGGLLGQAVGSKALQILAEALATGDERGLGLAKAVTDILALRVEYRSHFHPRVREELDLLDHHRRNADTGVLETTVPVVDTSPAGAETVLACLQDLAVEASYLVRQRLLKDAAFIAKILFAAAEQFDDSFVRSGTSRREWHRFCRSYRHELFPGAFDNVQSQSSQIKAAWGALQQARSAVDLLQS